MAKFIKSDFFQILAIVFLLAFSGMIGTYDRDALNADVSAATAAERLGQ